MCTQFCRSWHVLNARLMLSAPLYAMVISAADVRGGMEEDGAREKALGDMLTNVIIPA